jgi:WD40 repeat protein
VKNRPVVICGILLLCGLLLPAACAVEPLWSERAPNGEFSCVVISEDGSTIVAGGDSLLALSPGGRRIWAGWSGTRLAISRDGNLIASSRDQTVRLITSRGTMAWDRSLVVPVADVAMTPDGSVIAASGGLRLQLFHANGSGLRLNTSLHVNHVRLFPSGDGVVVTAEEGVQTSNLSLLTEWADWNVTQDLVEVPADSASFVTVTNNRIRLYTRDGRMRLDRALPGGNALAFALSRDGSTIVVGRDDNTILALDRSGTLLWTDRAGHWVTSVAVSDDGNTIVAGSMDRTVTVYDRAGTNLGTFKAGEPIKARSVAVSGDGSVIAAVDASNVYGFSRSQFTPAPAPVVTTTAPPVPGTTLVPRETPAVPVPAGTGTQRAAISPALPLLVLAVFLLIRRDRF